jgi:malate dehydrogenase (oxaloacetate-decarboxylating)
VSGCLKPARPAGLLICATGVGQLIPAERLRKGQLVFALSTPDPEIDPAAALAAGAAVAADGRSINNALCFPGLFDGALRCRTRGFTESMLVAAAGELATAAAPGQLLPDPLDITVHKRLSQAVQSAASVHANQAKLISAADPGMPK